MPIKSWEFTEYCQIYKFFLNQKKTYLYLHKFAYVGPILGFRIYVLTSFSVESLLVLQTQKHIINADTPETTQSVLYYYYQVVGYGYLSSLVLQYFKQYIKAPPAGSSFTLWWWNLWWYAIWGVHCNTVRVAMFNWKPAADEVYE